MDLLAEYIHRGFNLVPIPTGTKVPDTKEWNQFEHLITSQEQLDKLRKTKSRKLDGNIGVHLFSSNLCSFDVDDMDLTRKALAVVGLDPDKILKAGWLVKGNPLRGRAIFKASHDLGLASHKLIKTVIDPEGKPQRKTIFELRGFASHEQDILPPSIHPDTKKPYTSAPLPMSMPGLPKEVMNFWHDFDELLPSMLRVVGSEPRYDTYGSQHLRHNHDYAGHFNKAFSVVDILERNGYSIKPGRGRGQTRARHPNSTSGSFSARQIPGTQDLWQSDNGNDPLFGLFDAWCAFVDLEHSGDTEAAAKKWKPKKVKLELKPTKETTDKNINYLEDFFNGNDIAKANLPKPVFRVEGLFPPGVHLLAGDIKLGKSYLMAQACLAVSSGVPLLSCKTRKCKTLMLDLEGSPHLLKTRLQGMPKALGINDDALDNALFRLSWPRGLEAVEQLDALLEADLELRFVVIDTLARIRDDTGARGNQYNLDYDSVSPWADLRKKYHDLTIMIVHHVRKMTADDAHEMVSGTFGLGGAVDGTFVLLRPNRTGSSRISEHDKPALKNLAEFYGRTRYGEDVEMVLQRKPFNLEHDSGFIWALSSVKPWEILISLEHDRILEVMREQPDKTWTAKEISEELGKRPNTVSQQLWKMAKRGIVESLPGVGYRLPVERERKF